MTPVALTRPRPTERPGGPTRPPALREPRPYTALTADGLARRLKLIDWDLIRRRAQQEGDDARGYDTYLLNLLHDLVKFYASAAERGQGLLIGFD